MNAAAERAGVKVVKDNILGEPGTGFEKRAKGGVDLGEFECGNCQYFDGMSCGQATMMAKSKQPKLKSGRVQVEPEDCCEYVDRVGRDEADEDEDED